MKITKKILIHCAIWGFVAITAFPTYWIVSTSLKQEALATRMPPVLLFLPTFRTFINLFVEYDFLPYLINSFIVTTVVVLLSLSVGTFAAYSLARYKTGGKFLTLLILIVQMIPPMVIVFSLFIMFQRFDLIDTRIALILAQTSFTMPFIIWIMRQFFMQIPLELEEAAQIDGASPFQVFYKIILPISIPGLVSVLIFTFIFSWNEFLYALSLTLSNAETVTVAAATFIQQYDILISYIDAATTVLIIPPLIITLLMRRYIVTGLIGGAVKG